MSARDLFLFSANSKHTGSLRIDGIPAEDQTLTAVSTIADADGMGTLHYRWFIGDSLTNRTGPIGTDSPTLPLTYAEKDKYIFCEAYYTDLGGDSEVVLAISARGPVVAVDHQPTGSLTITGNFSVGSVITATINNLADPDGLGTLHYQWYSGTDLVGTDSSTYTTVKTDIGKMISYTLSYTDGRGNIFLSPKVGPIGPIADNPTTGAITIAGTKVDEIVTPTSTVADADGIASTTYSWQLYSANPPTAATKVGSAATGNTFTLGASAVNNYLQCIATVTDNNGIVTAIASNVIGPIADVNRPMTGTVVISGGTNVGDVISITSGVPTIADADGLGTITYEWYSASTLLFSTTDATKTYTTVTSDIGNSIYVRIKQTDSKGNPEAIISNQLNIPTPRPAKPLITDIGAFATSIAPGASSGTIPGTITAGTAFVIKMAPFSSPTYTAIHGHSHWLITGGPAGWTAPTICNGGVDNVNLTTVPIGATDLPPGNYQVSVQVAEGTGPSGGGEHSDYSDPIAFTVV
jgi:hypothetical protein